MTLMTKTHPARQLYKDFHNYRDETNEIIIYVPEKHRRYIEAVNKKIAGCSLSKPLKPRVWRIDYISDDKKGINWFLKNNVHAPEFKEYIVEARINPKILAGIKDYITASNDSYLEIVERRFNEEASKISKLLGKFSDYTPKRIDFCVNFDIKELGILDAPCTPGQMMWLIKRGSFPSHFNEWTFYDKISHRRKAGKYSLYLRSGSVNINCYYKYKQLVEEFPDCPDIEKALHVIRFEIQCLYRKTRLMMLHEKKLMDEHRDRHGYIDGDFNSPIEIIKRMLSDFTAEKVINNYFNKIIKPGDYYTLKEAIKIIESENFRPDTEQLLIDTLKEINRQGIAKTRAEIVTIPAQRLFYNNLQRLAKLGINPVTIPKSFRVKHIPNLLSSFHRLRESGDISDCYFVDPFDPLDRPFELCYEDESDDEYIDSEYDEADDCED